MPIMLTPETEALLQKKASDRGENIDQYADSIIAEALAWDEQDHLEAVEGIHRGLEAIQQGRCRPFKEFVAEQRAKYKLPHSTQDKL